MSIVDISRKPDVYRYARASAELDAVHCGASVAQRAAVNAYRYLPFLHPLPLTAAAGCSGGRLWVEGVTQWQTGVEMDVLFGVLAGAVASGAAEVRKLRVETKVKGVVTELKPAVLGDVPLARKTGVAAAARGELKMKNSQVVKSPVEKGHPIYAAQAAAALSVKRLCELTGGRCPHVQYFKIDIDVADVVVASVEVRARDLSPTAEALFAAGVALLTIWDMVKKFEKEDGQYPHTEISIKTWGLS